MMVGEPGPAALAAVNQERRLLIIDDDTLFRDRLARAMEHRGFAVATADAVSSGLERAETFAPNYAVVDLRLGQSSGLDLVNGLRKIRPTCRVVMLTGYGNFASAVAAIKAGAVDYLPKPADADAIAAALLEHHELAAAAAGIAHDCRPGTLGAHPARVRAVRPQCFGNGPAFAYASAHAAADSRQARAAQLTPSERQWRMFEAAWRKAPPSLLRPLAEPRLSA